MDEKLLPPSQLFYLKHLLDKYKWQSLLDVDSFEDENKNYPKEFYLSCLWDVFKTLNDYYKGKFGFLFNCLLPEGLTSKYYILHILTEKEKDQYFRLKFIESENKAIDFMKQIEEKASKYDCEDLELFSTHSFEENLENLATKVRKAVFGLTEAEIEEQNEIMEQEEYEQLVKFSLSLAHDYDDNP
ncbi:hypothetical protein Sta7437_4156 [Stanieria cyanosphaera PCC 7437]|uniref:Uncharacterized protein n=1 Tax=Stanieria cyanosphaera (strain ATCC 29371 / PCC 7437) TaxID=111780 RepID=K9XYP8_STAC7|nr:hypothetical protein [Stanieria cyanosphaera]AFZ37633.1 hypothetical protein Sta7437_4156 [Stanieria cyanosphaera PCC 7437]